jgi:hypothetical protein
MGHLAKDLAAAAVVRHIVIHLNTTIHRSGVHHNAMRGQPTGPIPCEAELQPIIRGDRPASGTFDLYSQHHNCIKIMQIRLKIV